MSNATPNSPQSGQSRRRRSRGGRNRNNQHKQHDNRRSGDHRGSSNRVEEFRPQGPRPPRNAPPPVQLSWWQKLLKAIGLYKEPTQAARPERPATPQPTKQQPAKAAPAEARQPKSNTRNARTNEPQGTEKSGHNPKQARPPRSEKPRGGDGSTVESPRVYVGNLSYDVTEQDLQELFKGVGPVRNVEIVYNRSTHRSKGYGFVEMLHKDEAVRSVEVLHDQHFMGRKLIVSGAKSKGQDEREEREERPSQPQKVTLAPIPPATEAIVETTEAIAEPVIQTIVETVEQAPAPAVAEVVEAVETPVVSEINEVAETVETTVTETTEDLVSKYSFDEPTAETKEA